MDLDEYYKKIEEFLSTAANYETHALKRNTSTREMMTALRRGWYLLDKLGHEGKHVDYFILDGRYVVLYPNNHDIPKVPVSGSITATEYKSGIIGWITLGNQPCTEILVVLKNDQKVRLFVKPYGFKAQTYFDIDYRKEWHNGEMVYEGNNYGDTSIFYIVGEIIP